MLTSPTAVGTHRGFRCAQWQAACGAWRSVQADAMVPQNFVVAFLGAGEALVAIERWFVNCTGRSTSWSGIECFSRIALTLATHCFRTPDIWSNSFSSSIGISVPQRQQYIISIVLPGLTAGITGGNVATRNSRPCECHCYAKFLHRQVKALSILPQSVRLACSGEQAL